MINEEFVSYFQAEKLRNLGFDEPCFTSYDDEKRLRNPFDYNNFIKNSELSSGFIAAPLFQQAFKWIAIKYGVYVKMECDMLADNLALNELLNHIMKIQQSKTETA